MSDADKPLNKKDQKRLVEKRGEGIGKDYIPFVGLVAKNWTEDDTTMVCSNNWYDQ